ncbi:hypothetical protein A3F08_01560 [Candidatus Berkelbacteria bacterium RIFCSPHIGHO2_12_FULL_36_9]|uniref:Peptidase C39-like domain-containing protein n=1 Tax=Candidatus Berkelbacteria bacterium RIFCSPHIGHO2_12_FULL_36_9 TaxID=1797469 RepID=A0A1F5EKD8_9BACT|nr:MAG: hypothetical protein A3F08_01560 [Candidatus Berkelbacteria bacterium RIFCSPHIGHO2_12_FULL_36_9]
MKHKLSFIIFCAIFILAYSQFNKPLNKTENINIVSTSTVESSKTISEDSKPDNPKTSPSPTKPSLPSSVNLKISFISQAPLFNWDDLHNDACEEAAILNVISYLNNQTLSAKDADQELINMVRWQEENFGGHYDLPMEKVKEFIDGYYSNEGGLASFIKYDISIDSIKYELVAGNPVIVPAAGRSLGNPNFRQPGPVYHMLVIRGYDDRKGEFITNDVGTRKGEGYRYKYQKLYEAIHDMPKWQQNKSTLDANPEMIFEGKKAMIVIDK